MEHIIQFGVNIDDDAIRREVVRLATREIIEDLKGECRKELGLTGNRYSRSQFVDSMVDGILADCREQVVREAASALADKAPKQKWYREMMPSAVAERGEYAYASIGLGRGRGQHSLDVRDGDRSLSLRIKYCPMCGRKLVGND